MLRNEDVRMGFEHFSDVLVEIIQKNSFNIDAERKQSDEAEPQKRSKKKLY